MRLHFSTFFGMVVMIYGASIVGRVIQVLSLNETHTDNEDSLHNEDIENIDQKDLLNTFKNKEHADFKMDNLSKHLVWFMQISDLHLSIFHDQRRILQFQEFVNSTLDIIKPPVVLVSGDLTDAKMRDNLGSRQYLDEWKIYKDILKKSKVSDKTVWLDIRGNHDNFDVPSLNSSNNYYQVYSIQGQLHQRSYMYTLQKEEISVSFIGVDACLLPGPRRPFNFIGVLTNKEMEALRTFKEKSKTSNNTIWFGHYPTSCIISPNQGLRQLMKGSLAYLCGHLHTLGGYVSNLYTRQQTGSLELELGDWKDNRLFRVAAIDHGIFSFADVSLNDWPVIIITNPKNALFAIPQNEPLHLISKSTHVRVLVWSDCVISSVKMRFNDSSRWKVMHHVKGPLFAAAWNPQMFDHGIQTIEIKVEDSQGRSKVVSQQFSLDGSQPDFSFIPRALLMSNISSVFQFFFAMSICLCIVPLCVIRWMHYLIKEKRMTKPRFSWWLIKLWLRKIWILCSVNKLFWPTILSIIYLPLGPWFIGEVLNGHVGVVFAWGTFVYSSYLPGSLTYCYGFLQIVFFHFPLILLTAHVADLRFQALFLNKQVSGFARRFANVLFSLLLICQCSNAYYFYLAYGAIALVLGPLRTWAVLLGIYLWYQASNLSPKDLRAATDSWAPKGQCLGQDESSGSDDETATSSTTKVTDDKTSSYHEDQQTSSSL